MLKKDVTFEGECIFVRTVTYHYIGRCVHFDADWIVLEDASWCASSGRWAEFLKTGKAAELEPYPDGHPVYLARGAIVEVTDWPHDLPREVIE